MLQALGTGQANNSNTPKVFYFNYELVNLGSMSNARIEFFRDARNEVARIEARELGKCVLANWAPCFLRIGLAAPGLCELRLRAARNGLCAKG